jgi:secondary thiamine-phosphate synthase enzyme
MLQELHIKTAKKEEIWDITPEIKKIVEKSKIKEGICLVYAKHATAAIIINENYDPNVREDILTALRRIVPEHAGYKHNCIDNNAAAHIRSAVVGPGKVIPIKNNKLELGTWQGIALAEFDGPRERHVVVEILA